MFKSHVFILLILVWLFTIFVPSINSLLNDDENIFTTITLNEEEQQEEEGKNNIDEKLVVEQNPSSFSLLSQLKNSLLYDFYLLGDSDNTSKIVLPPPEFFI